MIFLVDAKLPVGLARWLAVKGHTSHHVSDIRLQSASDEEIWNYAHAHNAIVITKDEDFANRRILSQRTEHRLGPFGKRRKSGAHRVDGSWLRFIDRGDRPR